MRCTVSGKYQTFAFGEQRINRVEQLFLGARFANDELDIVNQQQIEAAQARLKFDHLILLKRLDEFHHETLCAAIKDARARVGLQIGMADGVQKMRFALAGRGLEIERRELRAFGCSHPLGGIASKDVRLAGHKGCKGQRWIKPNAGCETSIAQSVSRDCHHRCISAIIGRTAAIRMQIEISHLPTTRMH